MRHFNMRSFHEWGEKRVHPITAIVSLWGAFTLMSIIYSISGREVAPSQVDRQLVSTPNAIDCGTVYKNDSSRFKFRLTNKAEFPIRILSASGDCACIELNVPTGEIAPSASVEASGSIRWSDAGRHVRRVQINFQASRTQSVTTVEVSAAVTSRFTTTVSKSALLNLLDGSQSEIPIQMSCVQPFSPGRVTIEGPLAQVLETTFSNDTALPAPTATLLMRMREDRKALRIDAPNIEKTTVIVATSLDQEPLLVIPLASNPL